MNNQGGDKYALEINIAKGFWTILAAGFVFGLTERFTVALLTPSAENIGLLTVAALFGTFAAFTCPFLLNRK